jgi:hypothetical protein
LLHALAGLHRRIAETGQQRSAADKAKETCFTANRNPRRLTAGHRAALSGEYPL